MTKTFDSDLVLTEDTTFTESIEVNGDIKCDDDGPYNLTVSGDIDALDIDAWNIDAWNIDAGNIDAENIEALGESAPSRAEEGAKKLARVVGVEPDRHQGTYRAFDKPGIWEILEALKGGG